MKKTHLPSIVRLMRPHHSIKNILLFLPAVFSGRMFEGEIFLSCVYGFIALFFLTSAVYIINDVRDAEKDRLHPKKCKRPVASGMVSKKAAVMTAVVLVALSVLCNILIMGNVYALCVSLLYFAVNIGYSMGLKSVPLLDVLILVSGFVLRVVYGSAVCGIPVSGWMYLTVMSASFYLGFGKRRNEFAGNSDKTRKVLKFYTYEFLDKNMYICNAIMIIFYSLWCTNADITERFGGRMLWTVPLLIVIFMKYSLDIEGNSDADPVEVLVHDKVLALICAVYAVAVVGIVYI